MKFLKDKTVIITGSAVGIGKHLAILAGKHGANVIINGRNEEKLQNAFQELKSAGIEVTAVQGDVTKDEDCENLIQTAIQKYGKLDILINNAGIANSGAFQEMSPVVFKNIVNTNLNSSAHLSYLALPYLQKTGGSIVFISSLAGLHGLPAASAYSSSKMALTALAQSLRIEQSKNGVHIGIAYVGFTQNYDGKMLFDGKGNPVPPGKRKAWMQQPPEKVAQTILKLIEKRKFKTTLSFIGKLHKTALWLSPELVSRVLIYSSNKMREMFEKGH